MKKLLLCCLVVVLAACSTSVKRVDPNSTVDLSGAWNDADSARVAKPW